MSSSKERLDKLESKLLKELFYGNLQKAVEILKEEEKLLKFAFAAEWLLSDVDSLPVGQATKQKLIKKGIEKFLDVVLLKPIRCEDYTLKSFLALSDGEYCAIKGVVYSKHFARNVTNLTIKTDEGIFLFCNWFRLTPYLRKRLVSLEKGERVVCEGKISRFGLKYTMSHPRIKHEKDFIETKEVVYPAIFGMRNATIKKIIEFVLQSKPDEPYDYLPYMLISKNSLPFLSETVRDIHRCENADKIEHRLKYEEIFLLILGLRLQEARIKKRKAPRIAIPDNMLEKLSENIGFSLTKDQKKSVEEIFNDIQTDEPMLRLLQGDVGCGKTIVALIVSLATLMDGYQVTFMAPTQPLASQIHKVANKLLSNYGFEASLLISSVKDKKKLYGNIENGTIKFVVGTHALLEESVKFHNLGLIVIDEQHRFGVEQRKSLMKKGVFPHVLIMSATPIPRSLSMVLYSKSSLSTIKEKPKGRARIKSVHFFKRDRKKAYAFAVEEMRKKHQVYVVAPLIEESENLDDVDNVLNLYDELKNGILRGFSVGLLHGKMNIKEKETTVDDFKNGKIDCLVSTTVIEVGIDSPNATVMVIENAERFGLSQLHQLRGRVGRGSFDSYAIFITKNDLSDISKKRMEALLSTDDGFKIAQLDYELRGSGEIMGIRQHGRDFVYTNIIKDRKLIEDVKQDVERLMKMHYPINDGLLKIIEHRWETSINYVYVG